MLPFGHALHTSPHYLLVFCGTNPCNGHSLPTPFGNQVKQLVALPIFGFRSRHNRHTQSPSPTPTNNQAHLPTHIHPHRGTRLPHYARKPRSKPPIWPTTTLGSCTRMTCSNLCLIIANLPWRRRWRTWRIHRQGVSLRILTRL